MQIEKPNSSPQESPEDRVLGQIGHCLRKGCVICIEHAPHMAPRYTPWKPWGSPSCYNGDDSVIRNELAECRRTHIDHHIRLNIEDHSFHSRFTVAVYSPCPGDQDQAAERS